MKLLVKSACLSLLLLSSCADPDAMLREDLAAARAVWQSHGIDSYDVHQEWLCECLSPYAWVAHVRGGQVESVTLVDTVDSAWDSTDSLVARAMDRAFTVEESFALIEEWIGRAEQTEVSYHERFGYPTVLFIDKRRPMVDEEILHKMRDLQVVPPGMSDVPPPLNQP
jgi:hypothetical protein